MALKKVRGNIERMFDKNLTDLVRGIRNSKENEVSDGQNWVSDQTTLLVYLLMCQLICTKSFHTYL